MVTYRADVGFLEDCSPALIERNAAEFSRIRDLLLAVEPSVMKAKNEPYWESVHRARYDARLADVRKLVTALAEGFGKARTALLVYADEIERAKWQLAAGVAAETTLDWLVSSVATPVTRTAQHAEPMRRWEDIRDTTGFLDWLAELGMDVDAIRDQATRAYEQADEAFSRARSIEQDARQECLAKLILVAAVENGLPPELIAGIVWKEVGGKPYIFDDITERARRFAESGWIPVIPEYVPGRLGGDPDETSYGPLAVQIRRGAEVLGYDPENLSEPQRDEIRSALKDPAQNLFIASEYLANLKAESESANVPPDRLTPAHYEELAARYNGGPNWHNAQAQEYGRDFMTHLDEARDALR